MPDATVVLDAQTRRNLEIDQRIDGSREHTLFAVLNTTRTPMGARLLRDWLNAPSRDRDIVLARQAAVATLLAQLRATNCSPARCTTSAISNAC